MGKKQTYEEGMARLAGALFGIPDDNRPGTTVYRLFDDKGRLLYVGITGRNLSRIHQHSKAQRWWPMVSTATFEHYESRRDAIKHEAQAIRDEFPAYNRTMPNHPEPSLSAPKVNKRELVTKEQLKEAFDAKCRREFGVTSDGLLEAIQRGEIDRDDRRLRLIAIQLQAAELLPELCRHCMAQPGRFVDGLCRRCKEYRRRTGELPSQEVVVMTARRG